MIYFYKQEAPPEQKPIYIYRNRDTDQKTKNGRTAGYIQGTYDSIQHTALLAYILLTDSGRSRLFIAYANKK